MSRVEYNNQMGEWIREIEKLTEKTIEIGIFGSESGEEILMRATANEFGANITVTDKMRGYFSNELGVTLSPKTKYIRIPERSFIRGYFTNERKRIQKISEQLITQVISLQITADDYFDLMGQEMVSGVQRYLTELKDPPNSPLTIELKGSSNPLIDTGQMRNSITYRVV